MYLTIALFALCMTLTNAAGAQYHGRGGGGRLSSSHRRHHARAIAAGGQAGAEQRDVASVVATRDEESCTLGAWKCVGTELQRCYNDQWNFVQNCTGQDLVCSDDLYTTGCVWNWSVLTPPDDGTTSTSSSTPDIPSSPAPTSTNPATVTSTSTAAAPTTQPDDGGDSNDDGDDDDCDDDDDGDDEGQGDDDDDDDEDLDWCDDDDDDDSTTTSYSASVTTAAPSVITVSAADSATTSMLGGGLWAGGDWNDGTTSTQSVTATSSAWGWGWKWHHEHGGHGHNSSSASSASATTSIRPSSSEETLSSTTSTTDRSAALPASSSASDQSASMTASTTFSLNQTSSPMSVSGSRSASLPANTSSTFSVSAIASNTSSSSQASSTSSLFVTSSATPSASLSHSGSASVTASNTSSLSPPSSVSSLASSVTSVGISASVASSRRVSSTLSATSSAPSVSATSIPPSGFSAPHYVIYADEWLTEMPSVSDLVSYNRFILAFWMTTAGAVDDAQAWAQWDPAYRAQVLEDYHNAGIALMVSAFGSTDQPTSNGADPVVTARNLAQFVIDYGLDGVDIDYEDMSAMNSARAVAWIVPFQRELRRLLPSPYIISHAPVAPWFTSAADYSDGAYTAIHQQVGDLIDFYNVQFYNQGQDQYVTCDTLIENSGYNWPGTSVFELNSLTGIPLNKIVIGKPLDRGAADNGYMSPSLLHTCVNQARAAGWNGGVMFWEWTAEAPSVMATVRGS
ncbi:hypothetical protein IAR55_004871 [Kwoniella newhampshirensis]|uniref:GH18 domain-containing protein n=1 Tax=Kwoniella newhampshirensis TaxID=1651941 RepID=A0AAW0YI74_9TREE